MNKIDINCDVGESYGNFKIGNDEALLPLISSCNIGCGFHGGDPLHMQKTVQLAIKNNVQIGAHPSFHDLMGFGRRYMKLPLNELQAIISYQISALKGITESQGGSLSYVKPHGALYNSIANNKEEAIATIEAIQSIDPHLALMGLAGSALEEIARAKGIKFIREAFADRRYLSDGGLMPRSIENAVIDTVEESVSQILCITKEQKVNTSEGLISLVADSICIHGDNPLAVEILQTLRKMTDFDNISIQKFKI